MECCTIGRNDVARSHFEFRIIQVSSLSAVYWAGAVNVGDCRYEKADSDRADDSGCDNGQRSNII